MQRPQRWPKGAFPEKYRWEAVERRLAGAWDDPRRQDALAILEARGLRAFAGHDDPYLRVFETDDEGTLELAAIREALAEHPVFAVEWLDPERVDDRRRIAVVASADPVDAVVAIGVAGPKRGIGNAAVVRFVIALRALSRCTIDAIGEDRMRVTIVPRDDDTARSIAERVLQLCQGMATAGTTPDALVSRMTTEHALELDWA
ncbi:MAG: hypothetical protein M3Y87_05070 [Myxococcota bacterium]|nr:hypothetical protein [Myxococcota bacterium]